MRSIVAVLAGGAVAAVLFQAGAVVALVMLYGIPLGAWYPPVLALVGLIGTLAGGLRSARPTSD